MARSIEMRRSYVLMSWWVLPVACVPLDQREGGSSVVGGASGQTAGAMAGPNELGMGGGGTPYGTDAGAVGGGGGAEAPAEDQAGSMYPAPEGDGGSDPVSDAGTVDTHARVSMWQGPVHGWSRLPPGTFRMGTADGRTRCEGRWKETPHMVTLTRGFEISRTEITERDFERAMGYRPSKVCDDCPVANINWHELAAYCNQLSKNEAGVLGACFDCEGVGKNVRCAPKPAYREGGIYDCPGYRIMTEAEFEYALRAGTGTDTYLGDLPDAVPCGWNEPPTAANRAVLDQMAIYRPVSGDRPARVAQKRPNAWGIHDLAGNVWEKTNDVREADLGSAPVSDPWGAREGTNMTARGGSFHYMGVYLRSGDRGNQNGGREERTPASGGRCVRSLLPP